MRKLIPWILALCVVILTTVAFHFTQTHDKLFMTGRRYFDEGRYHLSLPYLIGAYRRIPQDIRPVRYLIRVYDALHQYKEKKDILEDVVKQGYADDDLRFLLAGLYYEEQNFVAAQEMYHGLWLQRADMDAFKKYIEVLVWQKKYDEAVSLLTMLLAKDPQDLESRMLLADALFWSRQYAMAVQEYQKILAVDPQNRGAALNMADALRYLGDDARAVVAYEKQIAQPGEEKRSTDSEALILFGKAQSLNNLRQYEEALLILQELVQTHPGLPYLKRELAKALAFSGRMDEADAIFQQILISDHSREMRELYADALTANQRFVRAQKVFADLVRDDENDRGLFLKFADVSYFAQDYEAAVDGYSRFQTDVQKDPQRSMRFADALYFLRDGRCVGMYEKMFALNPQDPDVRSRLVNALLMTDQKEKARQLLERFYQDQPDHQDSVIQLIQLLAQFEEYDEAVKVCREALKHFSGDQEIQLWHARTLSWDRQYAASIAVYDELIRDAPDRIDFYIEKVRVYGWMRRYRKARQTYDEALAVSGHREDVVLESRAKDAFFHQFDRRALKEYARWIKRFPDNPEALFDRAQVFARNQRWDEARADYQRILKLFPGHAQARRALSKIDILAKWPAVSLGATAFEADSGSRLTDVKYIQNWLNIDVPINEHLSVVLKQKNFFYQFSGAKQHVARHLIGLEAEAAYKPDVWISAGLDVNDYSDDIKKTKEFFGRLNWQAADALLLKFGHERRDVIENIQTLMRGLYQEASSLRGEYRPNRRLMLGGEWRFAGFSDGNEKETAIVDVEATLFYDPKRLTALYRYEHYGFDRSDLDYFSPKSFNAHAVGFEWQHFFNDGELFFETDRTYYILRYLYHIDRGGQYGHSLYGNIRHDINARWQVGIEAYQKLYEHRSVYEEGRISVYMRYDF